MLGTERQHLWAMLAGATDGPAEGKLTAGEDTVEETVDEIQTSWRIHEAGGMEAPKRYEPRMNVESHARKEVG